MNQLQTEDEDWKRADRFIKVTFLNDGRDWLGSLRFFVVALLLQIGKSIEKLC